MIKLLINAGANVNIVDYYGLSPLVYTIDKGNIENIVMLIEAGADVNLQDSYGFTPIMWATNTGNSEIVKALIDAGANVNMRTTGTGFYLQLPIGSTALSMAHENGYYDIAQILQDAGANNNSIDTTTVEGIYYPDDPNSLIQFIELKDGIAYIPQIGFEHLLTPYIYSIEGSTLKLLIEPAVVVPFNIIDNKILECRIILWEGIYRKR